MFKPYLDVLNRYSYNNILSMQVLTEIFIFGRSNEDISDKFRKILLINNLSL